jgi:hypothetical protein
MQPYTYKPSPWQPRYTKSPLKTNISSTTQLEYIWRKSHIAVSSSATKERRRRSLHTGNPTWDCQRKRQRRPIERNRISGHIIIISSAPSRRYRPGARGLWNWSAAPASFTIGTFSTARQERQNTVGWVVYLLICSIQQACLSLKAREKKYNHNCVHNSYIVTRPYAFPHRNGLLHKRLFFKMVAKTFWKHRFRV